MRRAGVTGHRAQVPRQWSLLIRLADLACIAEQCIHEHLRREGASGATYLKH